MDIPDLRYMSVLLKLLFDRFAHLDVSGMDFPGVVNMFVGSDCEVA